MSGFLSAVAGARRGRAASGALLVVAMVAAVSGVSPAAAETFSGPAIAIPTQGAAPVSSLNIQGQATVSDLNVTINGFSHAVPPEVDMLLEGPTGVKVMLMSDLACSVGAANGLTLTFDDAAAGPIPPGNPTTSGTYRPGDNDNAQCDNEGDALVPTPTASTLAAFNGISPNGAWKLHVADDAAGDAGTISSWSLTINSPNSINSPNNVGNQTCDGKPATIVGKKKAETIKGTPGDDVIVGLGGSDVIKGRGGNDTICGGGGADTVKGGAGNDRLFGEQRMDTLRGGAGVDYCVGGSRKDKLKGCEAQSPAGNPGAILADTTPPPVPVATKPAGIAVPPAINWGAVTANDLAGYNVYESTDGGATFAKLTPAPITATTFTGPSTMGAHLLAVTSVDTHGNQSARSNTISWDCPVAGLCL